MLTTDLLKFRRQNGQIKIPFVPLDSPNALEICSSILALYNNAYKNKLGRGELSQLLDGIVKSSNDVVFAQGIVKLIDDLNNKLEIENHKLDEINSQIEINNINKTKKYKIETNINVLLNEINNLKSSFDEINNNSENPFASLLQNNKQALISLKERLIIYNKNLKHLEVLKDVCSETGVKKFIIKDIVKLLNSLIQKYLNEIGGEFIVYFDETFDFKFLTSTGECEFSNFSAGERQRIQIATILAFRDIILSSKISANIFVIDELLDANVDTICIENVMTILKRKSIELNQNVFIISHRSELADNESIWDNIIKVTKDQGQSTYQIK
jgi:hypothetical protein